MKWQNHIIIGALLEAVINPALVPVTVIGATVSDWLEYLIKQFYPVQHRTVTHLALIFFCFVDYQRGGLGFTVGGLSHVLGDAFTISGVPFMLWSSTHFHLFRQLRTGNGGNYCLFILCFCSVFPVKIGTDAYKENGFIPFFYDWKQHYEDGLAR